MRIVVLDGYTLNPGDLDWTPLRALGEVVIYDRTAPHELRTRADGAAALLTNKVALNAEAFAALPDLQYVGVMATGFNVIDGAAARAHDVVVCNAAGYSTASVVQQTFALLLELTNQTGRHADDVRAGGWSRSQDFSYHLAPLVELTGLTMGIVGFGTIGRGVARVAQAFGMEVIAHHKHPERDARPGVRFVGLDELFERADVVSLHCPLTDRSRGMVGTEQLRRMKPTAYLINTARGPLVDEPALRAALEAGELAGAGLDTLAAEPPAADNPLLDAPNCFVVPHIAWATRASRHRLLQTVVENLRAFQRGAPQNVVN
ncbi:MAG: D-2-hydroxyacid dehydrogenase [Catalinimonas sp.]